MQLVCKLDYIDMKYLSIPLYKYYSYDSMAIGHNQYNRLWITDMREGLLSQTTMSFHTF